MEIRDLINKANAFGVKVVYDNKETVKDRIMKGEHIIYFVPVEGDERKKYERTSKKGEFASTSACIHLPDISITDIIDVCKNCDGSGIYDYTCEMIQDKCGTVKNMDDAFIVFMFLHEVGHWRHFDELECRVMRFIEEDKELEEEAFNNLINLEKQRKTRIEKGSTCVQTAKERKLAEQYMKEYRNIPKEKKADEFAQSKIYDILNSLQLKGEQV